MSVLENNVALATGQRLSAAWRRAPGNSDHDAPATVGLTRVLAVIGASGPPVFLGVAFVGGLLQPGYDMRVHTVSEAALGPFGWLQTLNFWAFGVTILAFAAALARGLRGASRAATVLLVVVGVSLMLEGIFTADPAGAEQSDAGSTHNLVSLVMFGALIAAYVFAARPMRRDPNWRRHAVYTLVTAPLVLAMLSVFVLVVGDVGDPLYAISGLFQRVLIGVAFGWITVTSAKLLNEARLPR